MKNINDFLDKVYKKFSGSYWGIIGGIFGLLVFLISTILHSMTESISFFTHWVSHLGWGPNGSEWVFKVGLIILGSLIAPYIIFLTRFLWNGKKEANSKINHILLACGFLSSIISVVGLIFVSIFGNILQSEFFLHLIGAVVYFITVLGLMLSYTFSLHLNKRGSIFQLIPTLVNLLFFVSLIIASGSILFNPQFIKNFQILLPEWREFFLMQIIPQTMWLTFFEWLYVIANCVWFITTGIHTLKLEKSSVT